MRGAPDHASRAERAGTLVRRPSRSRSPSAVKTAALAASLLITVFAAGCGSSNGPGASGGAMAQDLAYAHCMRSHGVHDFPDPTAVPGGGVAFQINAGPGSDLNHDNPRFQDANRACQSLNPGGSRPPAASTQQIAAELRWAHCMQSHGLPSFPDPNTQGAFDSSKFDQSTPAFRAASSACKSEEAAAGAVVAVPGHP